MRRLRSVSMVCICRYSDRRMDGLWYIEARILLLAIRIRFFCYEVLRR